MNSLKTAFVCLILLGVLYGMYQVLNAPPARFDELGYAELTGPEVEDGTPLEALPENSQRFAESPSAPPLAATGNNGFSSESPSLADRSPIEPPAARDSSELPSSPPAVAPRGGAFAASPSATAPTTTPRSPGGVTPTAPPGTTAPAPGLASSISATNPRANGAAAVTGTAPTHSFAPSPMPSTGAASSDGIRHVNLDQSGSSGFQRDGAPASIPSSPAEAISNRKPRRSSITSVADGEFATRLAAAWTLANDMVASGDYKGPLRELTFFYGDPRLTSEQEQTLLAWLDALAAKVIYSTESHLEAAYIVRQGDDLGTIANGFGVTREFLFNVNQTKLTSADAPPPVGAELKVVRGPFHGEMSPSLGRLTLFLDDCYAGRFLVRSFQGVTDGTMVSVSKRFSNGRDFQNSMGVVPAMHPENPLGRYVVEFTGGVLLHEGVSGTSAAAQDLSFSGPDSLDLHALFGAGSTLTIGR